VATCVYADDAYLLLAWPAVAVLAPERWQVNVVAALPGAYEVGLGGAGFPATADIASTTTTIRDALLGGLGAQSLAAVQVLGANGLLLLALQPGGLAVTATGPAGGSITAALIGGGDTNAASRAFWLERAKCGLPPCCNFMPGDCATDYTLMHAALAAHLLFTNALGNVSSTGGAVNNFTSMRLGPAALAKGASKWSSPTDDALAQTAPGALYLELRARYVMPFTCQ